MALWGHMASLCCKMLGLHSWSEQRAPLISAPMPQCGVWMSGVGGLMLRASACDLTIDCNLCAMHM